MKNYLFLFALLWAGTTQAQPNLNRIEYFVDTDPGFGAAIPVLGVSGTAVADVSFDVSLTAVSAGFHRLFIRARNANNQWSVAAHWPFYKDAVSGAPNLSRIEYFVDADPGLGIATTIPFTIGPESTDVPFTVPLDNVAVGFHNLFVRSLNADGRWSVLARRPFYKDEVNQPDIVRLEYFIDTDPGFGAATEVTINRGPTVNNLDYTVGLDGLLNGAHRLYVRAQNALGRWSVISVREFTVQDNVISLTGPTDWCRTVAFNIGFTATGTYNAGNIFTVQLSNPTGSFLSGVTNLTTVSSTTSGAVAITIPNSVALGSGYRMRVVSSNPNQINMPTIDLTVGSTCPCTTLSSVRPGNWTDPACWTCNRVPVNTDNVRLNHVVALPLNTIGNARSVWYGARSGLLYNANSRLRVGF